VPATGSSVEELRPTGSRATCLVGRRYPGALEQVRSLLAPHLPKLWRYAFRTGHGRLVRYASQAPTSRKTLRYDTRICHHDNSPLSVASYGKLPDLGKGSIGSTHPRRDSPAHVEHANEPRASAVRATRQGASPTCGNNASCTSRAADHVFVQPHNLFFRSGASLRKNVAQGPCFVPTQPWLV